MKLGHFQSHPWKINRCRPGRKWVNLVLVFILVATSSPGQQELDELERRLAKINQEIQALELRIKEEKKKEATLLSQLDEISWRKKLLRAELNRLSLLMTRTTEGLASLKKEIEILKEKLADEDRAMKKILVTLYKHGKFNFLEFLLETENVSAFFAESKHLRLLASHQKDIINEFLQTMSDLKAAELAQENKKKEIASLLEATQEKRRQLEVQETESKAFIQRIQRSKQNYERALEEQRERAEQLQSLMKKLAAQEIVLPFRFVPFYEKKGNLPWPISGRIITRFGLERHPQFNTITMNNGIEISPLKNSSVVTAVHPGKVVFADYFQGYGNLLIIDHGLNYYSLYGHCAEFLINKGDLVREGQAIALVGDSGSLKGVCLYFEIRFKTKPLDPLQWLKKRW